jgi:hypothetical protein
MRQTARLISSFLAVGLLTAGCDFALGCHDESILTYQVTSHAFLTLGDGSRGELTSSSDLEDLESAGTYRFGGPGPLEMPILEHAALYLVWISTDKAYSANATPGPVGTCAELFARVRLDLAGPLSVVGSTPITGGGLEWTCDSPASKGTTHMKSPEWVFSGEVMVTSATDERNTGQFHLTITDPAGNRFLLGDGDFSLGEASSSEQQCPHF